MTEEEVLLLLQKIKEMFFEERLARWGLQIFLKVRCDFAGWEKQNRRFASKGCTDGYRFTSYLYTRKVKLGKPCCAA